METASTWRDKAFKKLEHSRKQWSMEKKKIEVKSIEIKHKHKQEGGAASGYSVSSQERKLQPF